MAIPRKHGPYIWVTALTRLLTGDSSCEWAAWFKAQHDPNSWEQAPNDFDSIAYKVAHTALLHSVRETWKERGCQVFTENQNAFSLSHKGVTIGGRPDLIVVGGERNRIIDAKTGRPKDSDVAQVMIYQYLVPLAMEQHKGQVFDGLVVYKDHVVDISHSSVTQEFAGHLRALIKRLVSPDPPAKVPSQWECRYCPITSADCPERIP